MAQEEHSAVVEACRIGDAEQAATIIYDHVTHVGNSIIEYVHQQEIEKESRI
jgi:DNA-binding GntR family transcriptional regulator